MNRRGFTLVELLVVIAIIGILLAIAIPAIQLARESARVSQCKDNLKNIGLAALHHEAAHGSFPSGGWGWDWVGDPDRGFLRMQPGGWVYNVLPFMEQIDLWSIGRGIDLSTHSIEKKSALTKQITTPVAILYCPTRRVPENYPYTAGEGKINDCAIPGDQLVAKCDYAANCGDQDATEAGGGPTTFADADNGTYKWPNTYNFTGMVFTRSRVTNAMVRDGTSKTLLIGEKYLDAQHYTDGKEWGDNECATAGGDNDTLRTGCILYPPSPDAAGNRPSSPHEQGFRFGSAHSQQFNGVLCDGSVHAIMYEIDAKTFGSLCNRSDGQTLNLDAVK